MSIQEVVAMIFILSIPLVAIIGGVTISILKTIGRQRQIELAQKERIAAIERGLDPSKLAPIALLEEDAGTYTPASFRQRQVARSQGFMVGGLICLAVGIALSFFLSVHGGDAAAVGALPAAVGVALLISSRVIAPRREDTRTGQ